MKKHIATSAIILGTLPVMAANANAPLYANAFSTFNAAAIQHIIADTAMDSMDYYAVHTGTDVPTTARRDTDKSVDYHKLYGTAPIYGTMPMYGEWNDDGTAMGTMYGRSGGDAPTPAPQVGVWAAWRHVMDTDKYKKTKEINTKYDLLMAGVGGNPYRVNSGRMQFGGFGGYITGDQKNRHIAIDERGGYFGGFAKYSVNHFQIGAVATVGKLYNDIARKFGGDTYNNTWVGANMRATYDILLDPTFTLQPGVIAGYTWVKAGNHDIGAIRATTDNVNAFEFAPNLRAIKHIANGWYGAATARYVFNMTSGGDVHAANLKIHQIEPDNYAEYGIGLEKAFGPLNISAGINRRDSRKNGWDGELRFKYAF